MTIQRHRRESKAGHRTAKEMGCVIVNVDRIGRFPIDREVTIDVARAVGRVRLIDSRNASR